MKLNILTLNCQKGYRPELVPFLERTLGGGRYDLVLLQELHDRDAALVDAMNPEYRLLRARNEAFGGWSQVAILHRKEFLADNVEFYDFVRFRKNNIYRPEFGVLLVRMETPQGKFVAGSMHANALLNPSIRKRELLFSKERIMEYNVGHLPVLFGGDMNSGLPWEPRRNNRLFAPEFLNATSASGPTVDSRYVEPVIMPNKIAANLGKVGIYHRMKVDHMYLDRATATTHITSCRALPDRISDHSPLEVTLELPLTMS